jgi:HSP20 family protein
MMSMRHMMDRLMESAFVPTESWAQAGDSFNVHMDFSETPEAYEIKLAVPGVNPDDIDISLENNTLSVRGEMRNESEQEDASHHLREIRYGTFSRSLMLPSNVNAEAIEAECDNGILRLRLPKTEAAKPRRIQVRTDRNGQVEDSMAGNGQSTQATQVTSRRSRSAK